MDKLTSDPLHQHKNHLQNDHHKSLPLLHDVPQGSFNSNDSEIKPNHLPFSQLLLPPHSPMPQYHQPSVADLVELEPHQSTNDDYEICKNLIRAVVNIRLDYEQAKSMINLMKELRKRPLHVSREKSESNARKKQKELQRKKKKEVKEELKKKPIEKMEKKQRGRKKKIEAEPPLANPESTIKQPQPFQEPSQKSPQKHPENIEP